MKIKKLKILIIITALFTSNVQYAQCSLSNDSTSQNSFSKTKQELEYLLLKINALGYLKMPAEVQINPLANVQGTFPFSFFYYSLSNNQFPEIITAQSNLQTNNQGANSLSARGGSGWGGAFGLSIDPKFQKFPSESPYNAMANDPVNMIDPDGAAARDVSFDPVAKIVTISADIYLYGTGVNAFRDGRIPGSTIKNETLSKLGTDHLVNMVANSIAKVWQVTSDPVVGSGKAKGLTPMTYTVNTGFFTRDNEYVPPGTYKFALDVNVQIYQGDIGQAGVDPNANYIEVPWSDAEADISFSDGSGRSYVSSVGGNYGQWCLITDSDGDWTPGHEFFHTIGGYDKYDDINGLLPDYKNNMAAEIRDQNGNPTIADNRNVAEVIQYNIKHGNISLEEGATNK
jgi:hypothetical protein